MTLNGLVDEYKDLIKQITGSDNLDIVKKYIKGLLSATASSLDVYVEGKTIGKFRGLIYLEEVNDEERQLLERLAERGILKKDNRVSEHKEHGKYTLFSLTKEGLEYVKD